MITNENNVPCLVPSVSQSLLALQSFIILVFVIRVGETQPRRKGFILGNSASKLQLQFRKYITSRATKLNLEL